MLTTRVLAPLPSWFRPRTAGAGKGKDEKSPARLKWNPMRYEVRLEKEPELAEEKKKMENKFGMFFKHETWERVWKATEIALEVIGELLLELEHIEGALPKEELEELLAETAAEIFDRIRSSLPDFDPRPMTSWIGMFQFHRNKTIFRIFQEDLDPLLPRFPHGFDLQRGLLHAILTEEDKETSRMNIEQVIGLPEYKDMNPKAVRNMFQSLSEVQERTHASSYMMVGFLWYVLVWDSQQPKQRVPQLLQRALLQKVGSRDVIHLPFGDEKTRSAFVDQWVQYYARPEPRYPRVPKDALHITLSRLIFVDYEKAFMPLLPRRSQNNTPNLEDVAVLGTTLYAIHEYLFQIFTLQLLPFGTPDEKEFKVHAAEVFFSSGAYIVEKERVLRREIDQLHKRLGRILFCSLGETLDRLQSHLDVYHLFSLPYEPHKVKDLVSEREIKEAFQEFLSTVREEIVRVCPPDAE